MHKKYVIQIGKNNNVYITTLSTKGYDYGRKQNAKIFKSKGAAQLGIELIKQINPLGAPCAHIVEII